MNAADLLSSQADWDRTPLGYTLIRRLFRVCTFVCSFPLSLQP
jgi:hypothetical protein